MEKSAINKNIKREFIESKSRFLSVIALIFLGVFVFIGLKISGDNIRNTATTYFEQSNLADSFIVSNIGLVEDDLNAIKKKKFVDLAEGVKFSDFRENKLEESVRIFSNDGKISKYKLIEGRDLDSKDEILIDTRLSNSYKIGDTITITDDRDSQNILSNTKFKVVGIVNSPEYIDKQNLGPSQSFAGDLNSIAYIRKENFNNNYYTLIRVKYFPDNKYDKELVSNYNKSLKDDLQKLGEDRINNLIKNSNAHLNIQNNDALLKSIKNPDYTAMSREDYIINYNTYYEGSYRLDVLSNIFPVFFFSVALLVTLSTMTRLVDEQRNYLGLLKALGYSRLESLKKYIIYGTVFALIGSILGIVFGEKILSKIVFDSYTHNYIFTDFKIISSNFYRIVAILISIVSTVLSSLYAANKELKNKPVQLFLKKVPKKGSKILLERITFIWSRLSFNNKVTFRNLFRYKIRMMMTILGVSGCTALLIIGFGIKDSISGISLRQFDNISNYDIILVYNTEAPKKEIDALKNEVKNELSVDSFLDISYNNFDYYKDKYNKMNVGVISYDSLNSIKDYVNFFEYKDDKNIEKDYSNSRLNIKVSKKLSDINYKLNDEKNENTFIKIKNLFIDSNKKSDIKLSDKNRNIFRIDNYKAFEWYTGHYMYMDNNSYEEVFNERPKSNALIISLKDSNFDSISKISKKFGENKNVKFILSKKNNIDMINSALNGLNLAVAIMIVCSLVLAYIVLYNLTNINISERKGELSTIKVLGFYPKEVTTYIFKETIILTFFGILLGFLLGYIMHRFIIFTLPPDETMFVPGIRKSKYVLSALLTFLFSILVMLSMHKKTNNINMVDAMKED